MTTQKFMQQNAIVGFQLDEISTAEIITGKQFSVQVTYTESSNDWHENQTIKAARENEKLLFLLKS